MNEAEILEQKDEERSVIANKWLVLDVFKI